MMKPKELKMTRDRLKEMQEKSQANGVSESVVVSVEGSQDQKELMDLLEKLGPLYDKLKVMSAQVVEVRRMIHDHDQRQELEDKVDAIKGEARRLRVELEGVKATIGKSSGVVEHVARTHHLSLGVLLTQVLQELSSMQVEAHNRHAHYIRKELIITGQCGYDEEELESLIEESTEVFTQNLIRQNQLAKLQLSNLQERHEAFVKLEKSILELHQLFQEIAQLVRDQGEMVTRIENNIYVSQTKTEKGRMELQEARGNMQKALKKKFILGIILGVVVLIIILAIVFSLME
ncbi:syntaxin-1A-like isoform X2 [Portunus trituberculatus]|uniref:syntaxin-1A-like isoform X2 n=1 Tax=Portunus trituberculatus TaxID=210409 RepID=UPI001E1CD1B9|nr:syntaxin-1A-like isoform X2 [Portunus trituberculatus]XP_045127263.1 syntaxin-1A-like isoform X2 [Portunus trituberculatus]